MKKLSLIIFIDILLFHQQKSRKQHLLIAERDKELFSPA